MSDEIVFTTKWFSIISKDVENMPHPYYVIDSSDCVSIIATTEEDRIVLVKQYRPAPNAVTLELPSGQIEPGETPEEAARRELLEETGYEANELELLKVLIPETARLPFKSWCFIARGAKKTGRVTAEEIDEVIEYESAELLNAISDGEIIDSLNIAFICLCMQQGKTFLYKTGGLHAGDHKEV